MGKALLLLVLGASAVLAKQLYTTNEGERRADAQQADYQSEVIAREIATSAFNVGMGEMRSYGEDILDAATAFNGSDNEGRSGTYASGRFGGGSYTVRAVPTSGHSARIVATGRFGDAEYTMHDEYRVYVMTARKGGLVDVSFIESQAGYCSAVFYQAFTMDMNPGDVPVPVMLFGPDNRDRATARPARMMYVDPGTQMNFFIGVDKNCSMRGSLALTFSEEKRECESRKYARSYTFTAGDFDHIHHALDVEAGNLGEAHEAIWAFVEQKPDTRDRWRVGWEDIHDLSWDRPDSQDPVRSLQALKSMGYDGTGWDRDNDSGYRRLLDFGSRPDFSDQVIEINVITSDDPNYNGLLNSYHVQQNQCGETEDDVPTAEELDDAGTGTGTDVDTQPNPTPEPPEEGVDVPDDSEDINDLACGCRKGKKEPLIHRPPGNEANERLLCLPQPAIRAHLREHNDVQLQCQTEVTHPGKGKK